MIGAGDAVGICPKIRIPGHCICFLSPISIDSFFTAIRIGSMVLLYIYIWCAMDPINIPQSC